MSEKLKLFDDIERDYTGPSKYSESYFDYLNRTARLNFSYVREILENWFLEYNADEQKRKNLRNEFRSRKNSNRKHLNAFFELYLHQLFTQLGFNVEVEPEWEQGKPDFLVTAPDGKKILIEATGSYPEREFGSAKRRENIAFDALNSRVKCKNFFVHVDVHASPSDNIPEKKFARFVDQWLSGLNVDEVTKETAEGDVQGFDRFPSIKWKYDGWEISLFAIPKNVEGRKKANRIVGSMSFGARFVDVKYRIRTQLKNKNSHYGDLNIPYILALNMFDGFYSKDSLFDALFGDYIVHFSPTTNEVIPDRQPNGAWFYDGNYQKKRMSGLLIFKALQPGSIHVITPELWHHPYPYYPLSPEFWRLKQHIPIDGQYQETEELSIIDVLGIDIDRLNKNF